MGGRFGLSGLREPTAWDWTYGVVFIAGAVALIVWNSHMFWWFDDWDVFKPQYSIVHHGLGALLQGSGPQWTTLPLIVWRSLLSTVGLRHYLPYALPVIVAHLAVVQLSRQHLKALAVSAPVAAVLPLILLFIAAAYAELFWAFMLTFVGSVAFGLLAALCANRPDLGIKRMLVVGLLCLLAVMCSSVGVAFTFAVALLVLLRHGWSKAAGVVALPALSFAAWWVAYGQAGSNQPCLGAPARPGRIPGIFANSVEKSLSGLGSVKGSSVIVAAVALVGLREVTRRRRWFRGDAAWSVAAAVGAIFLYATIATQRSCLLSENGRAPRYAYFAAVLVTPLVALGLDVLRHWRPSFRAALPVVLVLVLLNNVRQTRDAARCYEIRTLQGREQLAASRELMLPPSAHPSTVDPQVSVRERDDLVGRYDLQLPVPRHGSVTRTLLGCSGAI